MNNNLYIVRHGKILIEERNKSDYLHLSKEGIEFGTFLDKFFKAKKFEWAKPKAYTAEEKNFLHVVYSRSIM